MVFKKESYTTEELEDFFEYCINDTSEEYIDDAKSAFEAWEHENTPECPCGKTLHLERTRIFDEDGYVQYGWAKYCPLCDYAEIHDEREIYLRRQSKQNEDSKTAMRHREIEIEKLCASLKNDKATTDPEELIQTKAMIE